MTTSSLHVKPKLTYLKAWLFVRRELGLTHAEFDKLVEAGLIRPDSELS